jgi:large subunit ribosomal protein L6
MSRIGKKPVPIPDKVNVTYGNGQLKVKGPKGELSRVINPEVDLEVRDGVVHVVSSSDTKKCRALQGLTRTLVANMITGTTEGFQRVLEINGVGYRAEAKSSVLTLTLGYSHPVVYKLPKGIEAAVDRNRITLSGIDKELLGTTAATIREFRKPEPYKGKGIKYVEEHIRRKVGKSAGK